MRPLLTVLFLFAFASVTGLGATWLVANGYAALGLLRIGPWTAQPLIGGSEVDPYARAEIARSGSLPLGSSEGLAFLARQDDAGLPLDGRCDLVLAGPTPTARFWTLTLYDPDGRLVANEIGRHGFTSLEVLRRSDGSFSIRIAPRARPGNWLPTGGIPSYVLALRVLDSTAATSTVGARRGEPVGMPMLTRGSCS